MGAQDLPQECWELIISSLSDHRHWEPLSLVSTRFLALTNHLRRSLTVSASASLPALLRRFPNLRDVRVRVRPPSSSDLDSVLAQIADSSIRLESLDISDQGDFPCKGISRLGVKMGSLRRLDCSFIHSIEDRHLFVIGSLFPLLRELNISYPHYASRFNPESSLDFPRFAGLVTDAGVVELASKLKELRKIDVSGNHFISDKSIAALSLNCPFLSELIVCDCDFLSQAGVGMALRGCARLSSISMDGMGIPTVDLFLQDSFRFARGLREISFSHSFISDEWLCLIAEAHLPLRKLSISHCYNFSFNGLYSLFHSCQELEYLNLGGANFLTDNCIIGLSKFLPKLVRIDLSLCCKLTGSTLFALVKNCSLLTDIKMHDTNIDAEDFDAGSAVTYSRVESLDLAGNNNLSDECIQAISLWCPYVRVLNISGCPSISGKGVREVLRNCRRIQHLDINQCVGITNLGIDFDVPSLEVLRAQGPVINDEALRTIARRCIGLLHLDLESCLTVTMEGLKDVLRYCERLRGIDLRHCDNVKVDGITAMILSRPSLRKIVPPPGFDPTDCQKEFLWRHGCLVCRAWSS